MRNEVVQATAAAPAVAAVCEFRCSPTPSERSLQRLCLTLHVRRRSDREQESSISLRRGGLCSPRGRGGFLGYSCEENSGNERLRKQPAPTRRCQGVVEAGEPQN